MRKADWSSSNPSTMLPLSANSYNLYPPLCPAPPTLPECSPGCGQQVLQPRDAAPGCKEVTAVGLLEGRRRRGVVRGDSVNGSVQHCSHQCLQVEKGRWGGKGNTAKVEPPGTTASMGGEDSRPFLCSSPSQDPTAPFSFPPLPMPPTLAPQAKLPCGWPHPVWAVHTLTVSGRPTLPSASLSPTLRLASSRMGGAHLNSVWPSAMSSEEKTR